MLKDLPRTHLHPKGYFVKLSQHLILHIKFYSRFFERVEITLSSIGEVCKRLCAQRFADRMI